jgi:hypothetical protein
MLILILVICLTALSYNLQIKFSLAGDYMPGLNKFRKDFVTHLLALDVVSLSMLPNIIALLLADGLTIDEQDLLGSFITDIGDELSTIAVYLAANETLEETAAKEAAETENVLYHHEQFNGMGIQEDEWVQRYR